MEISGSTPDTIGLPDWAQVTEKRRGHIARVASLLEAWGDLVGASRPERARWVRSAWLHDAMKDAPPAVLLNLTPEFVGPDNLRHGPAAAAMAARHGERDEGVLNAVRYHSVGSAEWDRVGRMLYMADYLEPGRKRLPPERDDWLRRLPTEPDQVLREIAASRIAYNLHRGWPLLPGTVAFWNGLVGDARA